MSGQLNNSLDNSEVPIKEDKHSIVGGYFQSIEQASQMKLYLENLKLLSEISTSEAKVKIQVGKKANGDAIEKELFIKDLAPKESEFDRLRRVVIVKLNSMSDDVLRVWFARFGTDNIFELSSLVTSYALDKKKRDEAFNEFNVWGDGYRLKAT